MDAVEATHAKNRFGEVLAACARAPVAIRRHGRIVAHLVAPGAAPAVTQPVEERVATLLGAAGARYATVFGSLARGAARPDSDIDLGVSFGRPMSADLRIALTGLIAATAGRAVDLIDLETAAPLIFARAMAGRELLCADAAARTRLADRLVKSADDRLDQARAARAARQALFK